MILDAKGIWLKCLLKKWKKKLLKLFLRNVGEMKINSIKASLDLL